MKSSNPLTAEERIDLINEVYVRLLHATESFDEPYAIGVLLAYLLGEISRNGRIDCDTRVERDRSFCTLVEKVFGKDHRVWSFITMRGEHHAAEVDEAHRGRGDGQKRGLQSSHLA